MPATTLDSSQSEISHRWPWFLPDGEHFLYVTTPESKGTFGLFVGSLDSDRRVYVGPVESAPVYTSGMLVYMVNQGLEARPFNLGTLRWSGDPHPIAAFPGYGGSIAEPHASASQTGTLVYAFEAGRDSRLLWIDPRTGAERELAKGPYYEPSLSPDGRRIVAERVEGSGRSSVWMIDAVTGAAERWTDPVGLSLNPVWSPRGDSIVYGSNRTGLYELVARAADGALGDRTLYSADGARLVWPNAWSADGAILFDQFDPATSYDIYELRGGVVTPVIQTAERDAGSSQSPDGRWLAFTTRRSGRSRVGVMDRRTRAQYLLAPEGAVETHWGRANGALYLSTTAHEIFEVRPAGPLPADWPVRRLARTGYLTGFDIDPRRGRLLCCVQGTSSRPEEVAVLINLPAAVKRER
jgi:Tol biopolymer transport system component